jgi:glycerol-3-phosphate dehydrogenase
LLSVRQLNETNCRHWWWYYLCSAWALAKAGYSVTLYERNQIMQATSAASTKLLHGGLRYLEQAQFRLVREALKERAWWLSHAPEITQPVELILPVYENSQRPRWLLKMGLWLYDQLAGCDNIAPHRWYSASDLRRLAPTIKSQGLQGGFVFYDGQMDDYKLGLWVAEQAKTLGVKILEQQPVKQICLDGTLEIATDKVQYDAIVNVTGPWAVAMLTNSNLPSHYQLNFHKSLTDTIPSRYSIREVILRGSHIMFNNVLERGYFLPVPGEQRICFALPYQGKTLVGTTEVRQTLEQPIKCSEAEAKYLVKVYNTYFTDSKSVDEIDETFSGVRPLIHSATDAYKTTREYALETQGRIVTVYGGKWTTARALGQKVANAVANLINSN